MYAKSVEFILNSTCLFVVSLICTIVKNVAVEVLSNVTGCVVVCQSIVPSYVPGIVVVSSRFSTSDDALLYHTSDVFISKLVMKLYAASDSFIVHVVGPMLSTSISNLYVEAFVNRNVVFSPSPNSSFVYDFLFDGSADVISYTLIVEIFRIVAACSMVNSE